MYMSITHSVEIQEFYCRSDLCEIKYSNFKTLKTAILVLLEALNFDFWKNTFPNVKIPKMPKFWATNKVKMVVFETLKLPVLILRKIYVAENFVDFHTV